MGDLTAYPHCVREELSQNFVSCGKKTQTDLVKDILIPQPSGPLSCLCSRNEECEITGENELDFIPNVTLVRD